MKYFLLLILCLSISVSTSFGDNNIDSLKNKLTHVNDTTKLDILIQLSKAHWTIAPSKGLFYSNKAIKLAEKFHDQNKKAKALLYGGVNAWFMGGYDEAVKYYQKSLTIAREIQNEKLCAFNLNNLGMVNTYLENYEKAIDNYSESSLIIEKTGDTIEYAKILNNIAELNMLMGNLDQALKQHLSVMDIIEESDEHVFLIWLYNDIGIVYQLKADNELALQYFYKALNLSNKKDNSLGKSLTMNHIGRVYLQQKEYEKAKDYFYKGLKYAKETDAKENINKSYKNISEYYSEVDNYKKALEYYKLYKELSDSIINDKKIRTIVEMQARYEIESTEKENRLLRKNIEISELTIKKNNILKIFLFVLLLLTILMIILIYSRLMIRKKKNKELSEKNAIIHKQKNQLSNTLHELQKLNKVLYRQKEEIQTSKEELETANKRLAETNATKDKFFSIIAHDLKSPFNSLIGFSNLLVKNALKYPTEKVQEIAQMLHNTSKQAYILLGNLLEWSRLQRGSIEFKPEEINLYVLYDETRQLLQQSADNKSIELVNQIPENTYVVADKNMLSTIVRNLISNAIKFTPKSGRILIGAEITDDNESVEIFVQDNGIGIPKEVQPVIFDIGENAITQGTGNEKGTGLGLILCKEFIEKHGGHIWVESEIGKGSVFKFTLPLKKS
ncbi:tetratricopeptide repeat protein [Salinivirga cyanobacteriivorans]